MRAPVLLPMLLATLLAPVAVADAAYDGGAMLGTASVHLALVGAPLPAADTPMEARVRSDQPLADLEARLVPPEGAGEPSPWLPFVESEGAQALSVLFPEPGRWRVELRAGGASATFSFDVWPPAGAYVEPADEATQRGVVVLGTATPQRVRLVDAGGVPLPIPSDVSALVESPDGTLTPETLHARDGVLALSRPWMTPGEHRVHLVSPSLRLEKDDRPALLVLVVGASEADVYGLSADAGGSGKDVPFGGVAVVAVALVGAALLARRRG